jgi:hypothetical protein
MRAFLWSIDMQARDDSNEFQVALVDLAVALDEWKSAGADVLTVVGAIQQFVFAINASERAALES